MRTPIAALAALLALAASDLSAQSVFNAVGMGLPTEALDGRARALGSLGIGLRDASFMPTDPAAVARLRLTTGIMVGQPSWLDYAQEGGPNGSLQGNRFPLMGIAYPLLGGMMSIQIGSFLDQHFTTVGTETVVLLGNPMEVLDRFEQDGAVSTLNVGLARMLGPRLAAGATFGRYAGSLVRTLARTYDPAASIGDYVEQGKWSYAGHAFTAGLSWDVSDILRVAGSIQVPTALEADAAAGTTGANGRFDLPTQIRLGASAGLAPGLAVSTSLAFADWSAIGDDILEAATAGSANGFGVGVELSRARVFGKQAPLRFGYRRTGLPFSFDARAGSEQVYSGGFGLDLNRVDDVLLAGVDFALERGRRTGGGLTERFWRLTASIVVSGT